jgi:hypothetical protein
MCTPWKDALVVKFLGKNLDTTQWRIVCRKFGNYKTNLIFPSRFFHLKKLFHHSFSIKEKIIHFLNRSFFILHFFFEIVLSWNVTFKRYRAEDIIETVHNVSSDSNIKGYLRILEGMWDMRGSKE